MRSIKNPKGFTLIECVMALALLSIIHASVLGFTKLSYESQATADDSYTAGALLEGLYAAAAQTTHSPSGTNLFSDPLFLNLIAEADPHGKYDFALIKRSSATGETFAFSYAGVVPNGTALEINYSTSPSAFAYDAIISGESAADLYTEAGEGVFISVESVSAAPLTITIYGNGVLFFDNYSENDINAVINGNPLVIISEQAAYPQSYEVYAACFLKGGRLINAIGGRVVPYAP